MIETENNNSLRHIVFDLDGTLINSFQTIYKTTSKALKILNISEPLSVDKFYTKIGHHFIDIFREFNIPVKDFEEFIQIYKEHYFEFIDESNFYPGLLETFDDLQKKDIKISLLTTKGQEQADNIINHFELRKYFSFVMGRRNGIANKPSAEPLLFICNEINISTENTMMVGDTELDIQCGKNANTKTCGAFYGYRTKEQLSIEKPDYLISNISEVLSIVGSNGKARK